jgi:hypothetical protein
MVWEVVQPNAPFYHPNAICFRVPPFVVPVYLLPAIPHHSHVAVASLMRIFKKIAIGCRYSAFSITLVPLSGLLYYSTKLTCHVNLQVLHYHAKEQKAIVFRLF